MASAREAELALRAAKLSRIPGMTIEEASDRFRVGAAAIKRARKDPRSHPTLAELAVAALTHNGCTESGALELESIAKWIDYVNHDACTEADVRRLLDESQLVAIDGDRWRLLAPWP